MGVDANRLDHNKTTASNTKDTLNSEHSEATRHGEENRKCGRDHWTYIACREDKR